MSDITKETVAEALSWGTVGACDAAEQRTLAELSRQQHEFIAMVRDYYLNQHPQATRQADALLALWPDDTAEEARDHE